MENQEVTMGTSFNGDVAPILPDGWKEGDDIFADAEVVDEKLELDGAEDLSDAAELGALLEDGKAEEAPTTGEEAKPEAPGAEETPAPTAPGAEEEKKEVTSRILKLKVNHEDRELDINAMSDEELIALAQKGYAFESLRNAQLKAAYRTAYQEQIDSGMSDAVARMVASAAAEGKTFALTDEEEAKAAEAETPPPAPQTAPAAPAERDFRQQLKQLQALYPGVKEMPEQVMTAYANGADLLTAYTAYATARQNQTVASLRKENEILKQNAAAAAKAPVKGVSGGGDTTPKKKDDFESGFDAGTLW